LVTIVPSCRGDHDILMLVGIDPKHISRVEDEWDRVMEEA